MPLWLHLRVIKAYLRNLSLNHSALQDVAVKHAFDRDSYLMTSQQRIGIRATSTNPFTSIRAVHFWKTKSCVPIPEEIARQDLELICIAGAPRQLLLDHSVMVIGRFEDAKVDRFAQRFPQTAANQKAPFR